MEAIFATVCSAVLAGSLTMSDNATLACVRGEMPEVKADGTFSRRGFGATLTMFAENPVLLAAIAPQE